ncbi:MAG: SpoIID/LytB domain-containing protein [Caldilineaceae bacterium]
MPPIYTRSLFRRHPINRLTLILLAGLSGALLGLLGLPHPHSFVALAEAALQRDPSPIHAYLTYRGAPLLDKMGYHLSHPLVSPDGQWLAVTIAPSGVETADLAETYLYDLKDGHQVGRLPGFAPVWTADSASVTLEDLHGTLRYNLAQRRLQRVAGLPEEKVQAPHLRAQIGLDYPTTIRVAHHPSNGCRDVGDWQVDVIPFEEYVARVVPSEMPASWPEAALAAQAVAARTYGWQQILAGRADYDVTDWANYQMMCDARYPSSDAAVSATAGQYITAQADSAGLPISAMYSAENGHPTLTNPNVSYLQGVPDLFALGRERWGHGYGLSQWGAYRRALAGQSYRQILGHYYSAIYLHNGQALEQPLGALLDLLPNATIATDSLHLRVLSSQSDAARVLITATTGLSTTVMVPQSGALWRAPAPLPDGTTLTAQLWLADQWQDQVTLHVDHHRPPAPAPVIPATVTEPLPRFTVPRVADATPALDTNWHWQGEALLHTPNSGATMADPAAVDGTAWQAQAGIHDAGVWYGPYTNGLPAGYNYRALFWLRANAAISSTAPAVRIARLDVTNDEGREILGLRDLYASDFMTSTAYLPFAVDFHIFTTPVNMEFRVAWPGAVDLALDRVEIWRLPDDADESAHYFHWPLYGQLGQQTLAAAHFGSNELLSALYSQTIEVVDQDAPRFAAPPGTVNWIQSNALTLSVGLTDTLSGLDVTSGHLQVTNDHYAAAYPGTLATGMPIWSPQTMTTTIATLPDGIYSATWTIRDRAGNQGNYVQPLRVDAQPPTATAIVTGALVEGWYGKQAQLALQGEDNTSGLAQLWAQVDEQSPSLYSQPISFTQEGLHQIDYWATDLAGNISARRSLTMALDLTAPEVTLIQSPLISRTVQVAWDVHDAGVGVDQIEMEIQQDGGEWQRAPWDTTSFSGTATVTIPAEISIKVRARAQDKLAQRSEWVELALWVAADWIYLPIVSR